MVPRPTRGTTRVTFAAIGAACLALAIAGCARNVPQDANSGKDRRYKGAKKIELENGEGRARDIVTYPGGDRVDWKEFEIPEGKQGDLKIRLSVRPARPGMDLAFNVYDQWFERVAQAKPNKSGKRSKTLRIKGVRAGKYYVQVYAPRRMDAARYIVRLRFKERTAASVPDTGDLADQIPEPPTLPAVVEPKVKTPEEIAAEEAARQQREAEEARVADERATENARLDELRKPVLARIRRTQQASSGGVIITINAGANKGVDKSWRGTLLKKGTASPLPDGEFKIIRVTARECVAKVQLSMDQVQANPRVELRRGAVE